ncbi:MULTISPECIES: kinase-associated lipoprotein B [unclassified Paenibacillus]|uniref:kinase-associated lipoprotein B n=1 Tax=unclassified Paenibacillus TaxID=185978 RepID=UPI0010479937|nr:MULTISPECIES: kinase-associated lipoprotein B [unclassified Paenibacillus]NIK70319.1 kinase-associated protein B [Paenibacillus sp. BK720]TCM90757.1 kinase-associated protein B [Paenibacillus sp. BK033]
MQENRDFVVPGALAKADVRSGQYIGEIVEVNGPRAVFKVLAVSKHPEQGDLHHPYNPDVAMFHERRALSYTEKTNVLLRDLKPFEGEVPDYSASLQEAVAAQIAALDRLMRWSARGLEILKELRKEYK